MKGRTDVTTTGSLGARVLLLAAVGLAMTATAVLVLSESVRWMRLGVVAALWAALAGAFLAARYRKQVADRAEDAAALQKVYELELEREVTARREFELEVEAEAKAKAEAESRDDLAELRTELRAMREHLEMLLSGGEVLVERVALRAEATRMRALADGDKRALPHNPLRRITAAKTGEADTDLIERIRAEAGPVRRADFTPHPSEVSDRWFLEGTSGQRIDPNWTPSWETGQQPAIRDITSAKRPANGAGKPPQVLRREPADQPGQQPKVNGGERQAPVNGTRAHPERSLPAGTRAAEPTRGGERQAPVNGTRAHPERSLPAGTRAEPTRGGERQAPVNGTRAQPERSLPVGAKRDDPTRGADQVPAPVRPETQAALQPAPKVRPDTQAVLPGRSEPNGASRFEQGREPAEPPRRPVDPKTSQNLTPVKEPERQAEGGRRRAPTGIFPPVAAAAAAEGRRAAAAHAEASGYHLPVARPTPTETTGRGVPVSRDHEPETAGSRPQAAHRAPTGYHAPVQPVAGRRAKADEDTGGRRRRPEETPQVEPAGSHTEGKSVRDLLAAHGAAPTRRRRRRDED
ncbi:PROBABLE CONSERVED TRANSMEMBRANE PROTEIN RICH IN ALANINE AND ARGININE AND PROLINE [Alloactinosynnema sp. L-07]|uniref:DUF6779 domain-containing protein n=1 Tax=Alloactinosynnema sp. L-07 TaxID=1653480 RepID=UPI00065EF9BB|nr:DUF6779 domain-containing protein [Alloactinosynnema sp. L-07]CRK61138.1 PROBABLE CONSERVED TRANSMEMBRANE PROTEIN RICH IN ALANINE AND ARGININE AND PROLINE [Alloactinosynnema sp. L-07]